MSTEQPEALRLAEWLENDMPPLTHDVLIKSAAELRRLHDEVEKLRHGGEPHNFCPDCGKRNAPGLIHTCTPPQEK